MARLEREFEIVVEWKALELHPEFPPAGLPRGAYRGLNRPGLKERIKALAEEEGLVMGAPDPLANTHLALLAAEFARDEGLFDPFHRRLFEVYLGEGKNIGNRAVLFGTAQDVGLDVRRLEEALADGRYEPRLAEVREEAVRHEVTGLPTFLLEEMYLVGAQPYDIFRRMAERAGARRRT